MQRTDERRDASQTTKGDIRQRGEEPISDEIAWVNQLTRLLEPVHVR